MNKHEHLKETEKKIKAIRFLLHRCILHLEYCQEKSRQNKHVKEHKEFYDKRIKVVKSDQEKLHGCFMMMKRRAAILKYEIQREFFEAQQEMKIFIQA